MKRGFFVACLFFMLGASAQVRVSVGSGVSGLRNFSPQQKFWAFGQTIRALLHFSPKGSAYASLDYYTEGEFENDFTATAKSSTTSPQQLDYIATGRLAYRQISLGWQHYFKGSYTGEKNINIYGMAGFGFLVAKASNTVPVDTTLYNAVPTEGESKIRKLTFDLGLGAEKPLSGNFFVFVDARSWLPASSQPSPYLSNQKNVPLAFMVSAGLRILFGTNY